MRLSVSRRERPSSTRHRDGVRIGIEIAQYLRKSFRFLGLPARCSEQQCCSKIVLSGQSLSQQTSTLGTQLEFEPFLGYETGVITSHPGVYNSFEASDGAIHSEFVARLAGSFVALVELSSSSLFEA